MSLLPIADIILVADSRVIQMVAISEIETFGRMIGTELGAEKVILFGSYAQGSAKKDSDVDLLVVVDTPLPPRQRYRVVRRLVADVPASFDIIVRTSDEYAKWRTVVNNIVYFADRNGRIIYEPGRS